MTPIRKISECWKGITVSVIFRNLSPIPRMVSEKFSSKNSKFYRECMAHQLFCHPAISQFLMTDISFNPACKELKIAQIAHLNQLFQRLHFSLYIRPRLLWVKLYANEEKCKQWRQQTFAYSQAKAISFILWITDNLFWKLFAVFLSVRYLSYCVQPEASGYNTTCSALVVESP